MKLQLKLWLKKLGKMSDQLDIEQLHLMDHSGLA